MSANVIFYIKQFHRFFLRNKTCSRKNNLQAPKCCKNLCMCCVWNRW